MSEEKVSSDTKAAEGTKASSDRPPKPDSLVGHKYKDDGSVDWFRVTHPIGMMKMQHFASRASFDIMEKALDEGRVDDAKKEFEALIGAIAVHAKQEDAVLYPELDKSVRRRHEAKDYRGGASAEKLSEWIENEPQKAFEEEHEKDHEMEDGLHKTTDMDEWQVLLRQWIQFHRDHLAHEERIMMPLMRNVADKPGKIALGHKLLNVDRPGFEEKQFAFVLQRLYGEAMFYCPMRKDWFSNLEMVVLYTRACQLASTVDQWKKVACQIEDVVGADYWAQMKEFGLHDDGKFVVSTDTDPEAEAEAEAEVEPKEPAAEEKKEEAKEEEEEEKKEEAVADDKAVETKSDPVAATDTADASSTQEQDGGKKDRKCLIL